MKNPLHNKNNLKYESDVMSLGICKFRTRLRSAKLSTSPLAAATTNGLSSLFSSSEFIGCVFGSEMIPTLAHREWPMATAVTFSFSSAL